MKKFIKVILLITNAPSREVIIESENGLHETEIYSILEEMFPNLIYVNHNVNIEVYQQGYNFEYKNGLHSVAIYRSK